MNIEMPLTYSQSKVVIALLKANTPTPIMDLADLGGLSGQAVLNSVRELIKMGLVGDRREDVFPRRRLVYLTEKGRKVAEHLAEVEKILEGGG